MDFLAPIFLKVDSEETWLPASLPQERSFTCICWSAIILTIDYQHSKPLSTLGLYFFNFKAC